MERNRQSAGRINPHLCGENALLLRDTLIGRALSPLSVGKTQPTDNLSATEADNPHPCGKIHANFVTALAIEGPIPA